MLTQICTYILINEGIFREEKLITEDLAVIDMDVDWWPHWKSLLNSVFCMVFKDKAVKLFIPKPMLLVVQSIKKIICLQA